MNANGGKVKFSRFAAKVDETRGLYKMYDLDWIYNYHTVDLCERVALEFIHHSVSENSWILNLLSLCCTTTTIIPSFHLTDNSKKVNF